SLIIGYSDHVTVDNSMLTLTSAWMLGANILEKHFTLDKTLTGNDHYHAMDPQDIVNFKKNINFLQKLLEMDEPNYLPSEEISRQNARRSMIAARDILPDEVLDNSNIIFKRPGTGISPIFWEDIMKGKARTMGLLKKDEIIKWENISFVKKE
ncbi:MAG: N-acetylneuraminate synthase family protein, partial [Promethearchaeota archaeon]